MLPCLQGLMPALLVQGGFPQGILLSVSKVTDIAEFRGAWGFWDNLLPSLALSDPNFWAGRQKPSMTELPSSILPVLFIYRGHVTAAERRAEAYGSITITHLGDGGGLRSFGGGGAVPG